MSRVNPTRTWASLFYPGTKPITAVPVAETGKAPQSVDITTTAVQPPIRERSRTDACMVDTIEGVASLVNTIQQTQTKPIIFADVESVNLSRYGSVAIIQLLVPPSSTVYRLDVHVPLDNAFTVPGKSGSTLQDVLESEEYAKVFFDVRRDSDALYAHYAIDLKGVIDLQLVEFAGRNNFGGYLAGLAKCINNDARLKCEERTESQQIKAGRVRQSAPEHGGSYDVFLERPSSQNMVDYCVQDVLLLPKLLKTYATRLQDRRYFVHQVQEYTVERIKVSQSDVFLPNGREMAQPPHFGAELHRETETLPFPMSTVCSDEIHDMCRIDLIKLTTAADHFESSNCEILILTEQLSNTRL